MAHAPGLHELFGLLDAWRHLPNYQLERRADIFFALYLQSFLEAAENVKLQSVIVPEFPIKRDLVVSDHPTNKSYKVDYVLFSVDRQQVYFVELKTDASSSRENQDKYLRYSAEGNFGRLLEGLKVIANNTRSVKKYHHLFCLLAGAGYAVVPRQLRRTLYVDAVPDPPHELFSGIAMTNDACTARIAVRFIEPPPRRGSTRAHRLAGIDAKSHYLPAFAEHVGAAGGELGSVFASSLLRWITEPACEPPPDNEM